MINDKRPIIVLLLLFSGCGTQLQPSSKTRASNADVFGKQHTSLVDARRGFTTKLISAEEAPDPVPEPPSHLFRLVHYDSPVGPLAAYLSQPPIDGNKHPAIIWIFGGFSNGIGEIAWKIHAGPENDQSASQYRDADIVMMYPSRRGENDNPGRKEGSYGEVDDIITAAHYLAQESYVDPQRIYLGGHSTGGTLALLVAESCTPFRCVFSFGPVADTAEYGQKNLPFDTSNRLEVELRAPIYWLQSIETPTFVFEGVNQPSNVDSLRSMSQACKNPMVHFFAVAHADHRSTLARINRLIAQKILKDDGSRTNIEFTDDEINRAVIYSQ